MLPTGLEKHLRMRSGRVRVWLKRDEIQPRARIRGLRLGGRWGGGQEGPREQVSIAWAPTI